MRTPIQAGTAKELFAAERARIAAENTPMIETAVSAAATETEAAMTTEQGKPARRTATKKKAAKSKTAKKAKR